VNFSHIPKFEILGCDKLTPLKMNLIAEIRMDKKNSEILPSILLVSLLRDLEQTNVPRCEFASYLDTS
jgi:hypothetical protein